MMSSTQSQCYTSQKPSEANMVIGCRTAPLRDCWPTRTYIGEGDVGSCNVRLQPKQGVAGRRVDGLCAEWPSSSQPQYDVAQRRGA